MAQFIRIREWAKYQHYKDRNPPWIKLYREMISSRFWVECSDASRVLAVASMMLAAATDNKIPASKVYIRRVAYLNQDPDYSELIATQFVEIIDDKGKVIKDASTLLASCKQSVQNARPETETETEGEKETQKKDQNTSARKARGLGSNNAGVSKAVGDKRHTRVKTIVECWYLEWAGIECPWDGGEAKQHSALLKATPNWPDQQFIMCLDNLAKSECVPKGQRPRQWLGRLSEFMHSPLDRFWKPVNGNGVNGNGHHKSAAEVRSEQQTEFIRQAADRLRERPDGENKKPLPQ